MSHELQYTSAERTLKTGVKGFGPVVATRGLPAALEERLVALSGYRHLFAGPDAEAALNPVNHSHLTVTVAGKTYHILSRICDAGFDYSRRSNKYAQHVAIERSERNSAGPAATLNAAGFMTTAYSGEPRWLEEGRKLPNIELQPAVCRAWQQATGDAGWGGELARTALSPQPAPVVIVFPVGLDPLPLVVEAQGLLPAERRWQVTFSTFYTKLPPGVECLWRCMPADDAETRAACRLPNVRVIDLTHPLGQAPKNPWVEAARTGKLPLRPAATAGKPQELALAGLKSGAKGATRGGVLDPNSVALDEFAEEDWFNIEAMPVSSALLPRQSSGLARRWWIVGAVAAAMIALAGVSIVVSLSSKPRSSTAAESTAVEPASLGNATPMTVSPPQPTKVVEVDVASPRVQPPEVAKTVQPPLTVAPPLPPAPQPETAKPLPPSLPPPVVASPPVSQPPPRAVHPLDAIRRARVVAQGLNLPAPPLPSVVAGERLADSQWNILAPLPGWKDEPIELSLENKTDAKTRFALVAESRDGESGWTVVRKTGSPAGDDELARIRLSAEGLQFRWLKVNRGMQPELLGQTRLTLNLAGQTERVRLQSPVALAEGSIPWLADKTAPIKMSKLTANQRFVVTPIGRWCEATFASPPQVVVAPGAEGVLTLPLSLESSSSIEGPTSIEVTVRAAAHAPASLTLQYTLAMSLTGVDGRPRMTRQALQPEALKMARAEAQQKVDECAAIVSRDGGDAEAQRLSAELRYWRELLARYAQIQNWLGSPATRDLSLQFRLLESRELND